MAVDLMGLPVQFELAEVTALAPLAVRFFGDTLGTAVQQRLASLPPLTVGDVVSVRRVGQQIIVEDLIESVATDGWRTVGDPDQPAFTGTWVNYATDGTFGPVQFRGVSGGLVAIRGLVQSGTIPGEVFVLPEGYRPGQDLNFRTSALSGTAADVHVLRTGAVRVDRGHATWTSLTCVFRADQ